LELSNEQQSIVDHGINEKVLVTAGAGTGKTETLVRRMAKLVDEDSAAGSQVLVLTFTRAVSGELRRRVASIGGNVANVQARTLDSFATRNLSRGDPEGSWTTLDYDGRIEHFTKTIKDDGNYEAIKEYGDGIKHLFVDEIQDLVGPRAEMVKAIVETWGCGFTLFGDPAQGIYNFQLSGAARTMGSRAFYDWLRIQYGNSLKEHSLTENYRAQTPAAKVALWAGEALNDENPDYATIYGKLSAQTEGLNISQLALLMNAQGSLAILSHTNCQAELISEILAESAIPHTIKSRSGETGILAWIGGALRTFGQGPISPAAFQARLSKLEESNTLTIPDPEMAWRQLHRLSGAGQVEIRRVHRRLRDFNVQDDLIDDSYGNIIVSTIHRAKGLEFDDVLILPPRRVGDDKSEQAEMARLLFVGMSRHRDSIFKLEPDSIKTWNWSTRDDIAGGRWLRRRASRGNMSMVMWNSTTTGIEIRGNDVDRDEPAPPDEANGMTSSDIQEFLLAKVDIGDELDMEFDSDANSTHQGASYFIRHRKTGILIGRTSSNFARDFIVPLQKWARFFNEKMDWPTRIEGARVQSIDTVAGSANCLLPAEWVGESRIWNRLRMHGLASIIRK
jgi:hypothetical protein